MDEIQQMLHTNETRVYLMFLRAHASIMRDLDRELQANVGISVRWLDTLVQLARAEDNRLTHTRLSERLLVGAGGVTRLVDRMAKAGLVTRRASRKDRRTSYVILTEKGKEVYTEANIVGARVVRERFTDHVRSDDLPVLRSFFKRVLGEED